MNDLIAPSYIRGKTIAENLTNFGGRNGEVSFMAPQPASIVDRLPLRNPGDLRDLYSLSFDDILDYLVALGRELRIESNGFLQEALEHSYAMADQTPPLLRWQYSQLPLLFNRAALIEAAEMTVGIRFLEGWNPITTTDGKIASIRALGSRALHVVAGNSPLLSGIT